MNRILRGIGYDLSGKNEELFNSRLSICERCPLYRKDFLLGYICSNKVYINPKTYELSLTPKDGLVRGCGCIIAYKARLEDEHCILNKW